MARVGFIGLGNMGGGMAANLARAGYQVHAFDLVDKALDRAEANGCRRASSAIEAVSEADAVISMLPAGEHVRQVYEQHVFPHASKKAILIDCSTIDVGTAREIEAMAAENHHRMVDAPVSGGIAAADAGTLTFMVGGSDAGFEDARPYLEKMGKAVIYAGGPGSGQAAKICNNMLLGASMIATCEAFLLAEKLGLNLQTFFDISSKASGQSWSMTSYCPVPGVGPESPADQNYQGGFASALMLKDLRLAMKAAHGANMRTPMGERAEQLYAQFVKEGGSAADFSGIIKMLDTKDIFGVERPEQKSP